VEWSTYGIKAKSVLNKIPGFHVTHGMPPDPTHDLGEGIIPYELLLGLDSLIKKGYFTHTYLQHRLRSVHFGKLDRRNITDFVPPNFAKKKSIGGNATKNHYLLRFLPLLVGQKVPAGDIVWECLMCLREIVQYTYAEAITDEAVIVLEQLIREHRFMFHAAFPGKRAKPKHHYLEHYPQLIREFGPLINYHTIRFEAKHGFLKRIVHQTMNFKNLSFTLAHRHQLYITYLLSSKSYFKSSHESSTTTVKNIGTLTPIQRQIIEKEIPNVSFLNQHKEISITGQTYAENMYLVHGFVLDHPEFCKIDMIFSANDFVYFLCTHYESSFCLHQRAYEIFETNKCHLLAYNDLASHYPLYAYSINDTLWIYLKHGVFKF